MRTVLLVALALSCFGIFAQAQRSRWMTSSQVRRSSSYAAPTRTISIQTAQPSNVFGAGQAIAASAAATSSSPSPESTQRCDEVRERKEWRDLSDSEKDDYIGAVQCLQSRPQRSGFDGVVSRFDDFQALHVALSDRVHLVAQFLPWHRRYVWLYETALREECGYTGSQPYWNWSLDVGNATSRSTSRILASPVFSAERGFGGNGVDGTFPDLFGTNSSDPTFRLSGWGGGCVLDGPFSNYTVALGPGPVVNPHCLVRAINATMYQFLTAEQVANTTSQPNYDLFHPELEGRNLTETIKPHDGGHLVVGGEMGNIYSSPGDPIFFLHHANVDRIWWGWQTADIENRLYQISGRTTVQPPYVNVTLDYPVLSEPLANDVPIRDVMDIRNLCYTYA